MIDTPLKERTGRLGALFLVVVAIGLVATGRISVGSGSFPGPMVTQPAPEVSVELFDGTTWRLSQHLVDDGRPVFLNLWASWCAPCEKEIPILSRFAVDHPEIVVVGAAVRDDRVAAEQMAQRLSPSYPLGTDATGRLRDRYVGFGLPALFLIDETGTVVAQFEGGATTDDLSAMLEILES